MPSSTATRRALRQTSSTLRGSGRRNIIEITDLSAPELDIYARLTQAQLRSRLEPEKGIFIAESPKV
ncbi:hypothetical protein ACSTB0_13500, partial [Faecalibacterium wellingii]